MCKTTALLFVAVFPFFFFFTFPIFCFCFHICFPFLFRHGRFLHSFCFVTALSRLLNISYPINFPGTPGPPVVAQLCGSFILRKRFLMLHGPTVEWASHAVRMAVSRPLQILMLLFITHGEKTRCLLGALIFYSSSSLSLSHTNSLSLSRFIRIGLRDGFVCVLLVGVFLRSFACLPVFLLW